MARWLYMRQKKHRKKFNHTDIEQQAEKILNQLNVQQNAKNILNQIEINIKKLKKKRKRRKLKPFEVGKLQVLEAITKKLKAEKIKSETIKTDNIKSNRIQADQLEINDGIDLNLLTFTEKKFEGLTAGNTFQSAPAQDTSLKTNVMYMIVNRSADTAVEARILISPNNTEFFVDTLPVRIAAGNNRVLIPLRFAKFTRVSFRALEPGKTAKIDLFFQAQSQS